MVYVAGTFCRNISCVFRFSHNIFQFIHCLWNLSTDFIKDILIQDYQQGKADFSQASFAAMDEWLYMSDRTKESCGYFLREHFLNHVNYAPENVRLWDGTVSDTQKECRDVEEFIKTRSVDSRAHVTVLDPVTQKVGQKYFSSEASLSGGITLGIDNFHQARRTVLMVNGAAKAEILSKILNAPAPDEQIPATALLTFENASLYCDREALKIS